MNTVASLRCLIYSHAWCVELLENHGLLQGQSLLVELAHESNLAAGYGQHGKHLPGLTPLLEPPKPQAWWHLLSSASPTVERVLRPAWANYEGLSAPLVLAAYPVLARGALESAVALLSQTPSDFDEIVLLAHVSDVPWLPSVFPYVEQFSVLWDIADLPSSTLPRMAEVLTHNEHLDAERWGGFHLCNHPGRITEDADSRWEAWEQLLTAYPMLSLAEKPG